MILSIPLGTAVLWSAVFGVIADRVNRVTVLNLGFFLAVLGYGWVGIVDNPAAPGAIPALVLLGIGQSSTVLASTLLLGQ